MDSNRVRSFYGGMGLARPMLTAMQTDNTRNFNYNKELYSDLASIDSLSPQHGGRDHNHRSLTNARNSAHPLTDDEKDSPTFELRRRRSYSLSSRFPKLSHLSHRLRETITVYDEDVIS